MNSYVNSTIKHLNNSFKNSIYFNCKTLSHKSFLYDRTLLFKSKKQVICNLYKDITRESNIITLNANDLKDFVSVRITYNKVYTLSPTKDTSLSLRSTTSMHISIRLKFNNLTLQVRDTHFKFLISELFKRLWVTVKDIINFNSQKSIN